MVLLGVVVSCAAPATSPGGVKRLPVVDKQNIRFVRLTSGGEALNTWVRAITQDNQGFIWFASNTGLFRYDGYVLKQYRHDPADPNTVSSDEISILFKDRAGSLWIGTTLNGVDRLEPTRGVFTHYRHVPGVAGSLSSDRIACTYEDSGGALWFGTSGGLDRLDPRTGTFLHYKHDPRDPASLTSGTVNAVHEDHRGNFWVGTSQGLSKLDRATGRATRFLHDPMNPHSLGDNYVSYIRDDRSGTVWVASVFANALSALDANSREFTRYSFRSEQPGREDVSGVTSIHEDADGALWLGTVRDGLLKLDRERKQFLRYTRNPADPETLHYTGVATIFEDAEGVIWAGTRTGISRFLRKPPAFVNYKPQAGKDQSLQDNVIWSVQTDSRGFLWIGTETALHRLDRKTGRVTVYRHDPHNPYSISHSTVSAIREDRSGRLWFGTYGGGLNWYDPATERFFAYRRDQKKPGSLSSDQVFCLLVDHGGTLWVGTRGNGLNRYDPGTERFVTYRNDPRDPHSLSHDHVSALFEDRAGELWVGTAGGLNRFDRKSQHFTTYSFGSKTAPGGGHDAVLSILEGRRGALWVGTPDGLNRLEPSTGSFTKFTMKDGLPDNSVRAILEDRHGDLWLATSYGLSHFSPRTGQFRNYSELDGLPANRFNLYGSDAACQTASGELVFGTTDGFTVFDPDRLSENPYRPPVVLTDFLLFNRPVRPAKDSPLQQPIWATDSLTLDHTQNIFALEFAALSYSAPRKNRYRYRLEGLEDNWNEVDSTRRLATYTSLPAGKYVFHVQGSNNDLLWNETGVRLAITVLPPWWMTWWFRIVIVLCVAGAAFAVHRFHIRDLRLEVKQRTRELEAAKDSAETANRAKSAFLAHMSHELRTPLNAIMGFARLLRDRAIFREHREELDIIHRSGVHLLTLINDVLDIARIEAGRTAAEIAPCDVRRLAHDVTDMMRVRAAAKSLELRLVESSELPRSVRTDGPKLRQVLVNLLGNAVNHTQRGSVTLRLDARRAGDANDVLLVFDVEDTGIGIAAEDQERIFEPFVQLGNPRERKGTGLGLAISRQFVTLLGGTLQVKSALGEGSLFRLELPVKLADQSEAEAPPEEREYVLQMEPGEAARRILVADDDTENRRLLQRLLDSAGFEVEVAVDGAQAVEMFQSWRPHFIWMDLRMPVMDGAEATRRIRALAGGREVKIAAATASAYASDRERVLAAGMDDFVLKPYRRSAVFDCLARHLGVRYRFDGAVPSPSAELPAILRPEALEAIPKELRSELRGAIVALDDDRIRAAIERISQTDAALGSALAHCAKQFAYTAIFNAIRDAEKKPPEESA